MAWEEVSAGYYERPFDSLEIFYRVIADAGTPLNKQHYLISSALKFKSLPGVQTLQNAWKVLRQRYPQIAATVKEDGSRFCYKVPTLEELEAWETESFIVDNGSSANEKYENEPPSSKFLLFVLPEKRELLFRMPHWRIDGIGLMDLQNIFLQILANGVPETIHFDGSEAKNLHLSLDEAAGVPTTMTEATSKAADEELAYFTDNQPSINIPTLPNVIPTTPRRLEVKFSADATKRVISACKARNFSVTTAIHAALVVATLPFAEHGFDPATRGQGGGKYTGFNAIDLRKYLSPPYNGPAAAASIYHTGLPISVNLDLCKGFDAISASMSKDYKRKLNKDEPRNLFRFMSEYVGKVLIALGAQPEDPLRAAAHPELSSIGIINDHVLAKHEGPATTVEVEDWWIAIECINRLLLTNVWTWNDEMVLSANWNAAFYEDEFVSRFLNEWKEVVLESLGAN
ncbi:uncharacterized protein N7503_009391 [Penicillium pulvis]|uniref:uncharacterized protein n=1 Tax=Penicillium pulvis TaxID=1562058 RepID=UPI002546A027|nr:uncharacterized protein N7503_009391 [Penicillium pulvis]KAJ5784179.1 hypothetical protein N7503_009391 [Penicillium pulvis]